MHLLWGFVNLVVKNGNGVQWSLLDSKTQNSNFAFELETKKYNQGKVSRLIQFSYEHENRSQMESEKYKTLKNRHI